MWYKDIRHNEFFCDQKICYSGNKGIPLYFDDDHLNLYGTRILPPLFRTIFNQFKRA
ncbi:SGNH hydrolase domain-containing protein [Acinetobacter baumannii]